MAQLRVTQKFATDLKLKYLPEPSLVTSILDDWFIDVIRVSNKRIAMITHGESKVTFFIPYAEVGGAKYIPACIPVLLNEFLYDNGFEHYTNYVDTLFSQEPVYCKTENRSVLGHMRNFKFYAVQLVNNSLSGYCIDWDIIGNEINDYLISINKKDYSRPIDIMRTIINKSAA